MKDVSLLVWLSQLGLSVVTPLAGFVLLAVWLQGRFSLGDWVIWTAICLGLICAVQSFRSCVRTMARLAKDKKPEDPPVSFNDHD